MRREKASFMKLLSTTKEHSDILGKETEKDRQIAQQEEELEV